MQIRPVSVPDAAHAAARRSRPTEQPSATSTDPTSTPVPETPLVTDPPTAEDVEAAQQAARVAPPGLARKGVTDVNGDGRVDGRDVAFAKHGPDHPGRGFKADPVGGTVAPVSEDPTLETPVPADEPLEPVAPVESDEPVLLEPAIDPILVEDLLPAAEDGVAPTEDVPDATV